MLEPLDLRPTTSWNSTLETVDIGEMMEAQLVNSTAPFTILKELSSLLTSKLTLGWGPQRRLAFLSRKLPLSLFHFEGTNCRSDG
jgi:hypothetical protein